MHEQLAMCDEITRWLETQPVERFSNPIPIDEILSDIGIPADESARSKVRKELDGHPIVHLWSGNRLYCLRLCGPKHVCLDQEDSVIGAAEAVFRESGYECRREFGSAEHIGLLSRRERPSLEGIASGRNLHDLVALRVQDRKVDFWMMEAKGKQAGFDFFNFGYALGQIFSERSDSLLLAEMLGVKKKPPGRGLGWEHAQALFKAWTERGFIPRVTVAVLVPEWSPDFVWLNKQPCRRDASYFSPPIEIFRYFIGTGKITTDAKTTKPEKAFRQMVSELEQRHGIRALARANVGLRFRLLTTKEAPPPTYSQLTDVDI
jgi:hypothetical protein